MCNKMNNINKLLKIFYEESGREFHIRLLARLTGLNPNTVINISKKLNEQDLIIIKKDKETNKVILRANIGNKIFRLNKQKYNLEKIYKTQIIDYLNDELAYPTVVLFGSYAKAENHKNSDIDLFIISDEKKKLNLYKFEKMLRAEIQVFLHTKNEFTKLKKNSKELINNVINGYVLSGFLEVL